MNTAIENIEKEPDSDFKYFLYNLYSDVIKCNISDAAKNLEEISDKEYCLNVTRRLDSLANACLHLKNSFEISDFARLDTYHTSYKSERLAFARNRAVALSEKKRLQTRLNAIQIRSLDSLDKSQFC